MWHQDGTMTKLSNLEKGLFLLFLAVWAVQLLGEVFVLMYTSSRGKPNTVIANLSSRCFHWFPAAMLVSLVRTLKWCLQTEFYKFAGTFQQITQTQCTVQTWDLEKLLIYQSFLAFEILSFCNWMVSNLFFDGMTVKTGNKFINNSFSGICKIKRQYLVALLNLKH